MIEVEYLTDELRKLVPHGATAHRLPMFPGLRQVCGIEDDSDLTLIQAGNMMRNQVKETILSVSEAHEFDGRLIDPDSLKRCFLLSLQLEGTGVNVIERRYRVMTRLGVTMTEQNWRKKADGERALMWLLAKRLWDKGQPDYQIARSEPA